MIKTDICIIGAGPGGVVTALFLAKAGIPCVLVDKAVFPRDKICGDALSGKVTEVLRKLDSSMVDELHRDTDTIGSWGVKFIAPNLQELRLPFKKNYDKQSLPPGFLSKRFHFDRYLFNKAKNNSLIQIIEGLEIEKFERDGNEWILSDKKKSQTIQTKLVIAADGAHSVFAKQVGKIEVEREHYCAGLRAYYKGVKELDADNFIELHFLKDFLPGYFWIFPLANGYANVGVGMRSDKVSRKKVNLKKRMLEIIEKYPQLKKRFEGATLEGEIIGYGLPLGSKKRKISGDGFMLVGDAGSLIDPFTGEGIGNAMMSGMIAARVATECVKNNHFSAGQTAMYDESVYGRLWTELKLSKRLQELAGYPWLFNLAVRKANKNEHLRDALMSMFDDVDLRQKLGSPRAYFKLIFSKW